MWVRGLGGATLVERFIVLNLCLDLLLKRFFFFRAIVLSLVAITMAFLRDRGLIRANTKFIKERLDMIYMYEYQVLDRLPDFMDAVAGGSQDDSLQSLTACRRV